MPSISSTGATSTGGSPVVKLLGIKSGNAVHLIKAIERGFSFDTLEKVRRETGLPLERLAISIGVSPSHAFAPQEREKVDSDGIRPAGFRVTPFDAGGGIV